MGHAMEWNIYYGLSKKKLITISSALREFAKLKAPRLSGGVLRVYIMS